MSALRTFIELHHSDDKEDIIDATGKSWDEVTEDELAEGWRTWQDCLGNAQSALEDAGLYNDYSEIQDEDEDQDEYE
jgi:hypothetical protein